MNDHKLLDNIEQGLMNYYLEIDHSIDSNIASEPQIIYGEEDQKYNQLANRILFLARTQIQKDKVSKIISIADGVQRLIKKEEIKNENIFYIFKKHIEEHGLAVNYRHFDKMTEDEMKNILSQLDLTALFNEIDENLNDK